MRKNHLTRLVLLASLPIALLAASCGSCSDSAPQEQTEADVSAPEEAPDTAAEEAAKELEAAQDNAKILGGQVGFDQSNIARFLASELEGMQKKVDAPKVKQSPQPKDDGEIDVGGVKRVFDQRHSELQACYERALKADPALAGNVTLTVRIGADGMPLLTRAQSTQLASKAALDCMERATKQWRFPEPQGGTVLINKPYNFTPKT